MTDRRELKEVVKLFLRLGFTAFGGPAAHIAMYHHEVVRRRKWLSEEQFLDLLGAANLIPGPNSTEMAIHLGLMRAGWAGFVAAGAAFILPAALIVSLLAEAYVRYGALPAAADLMYAVKPIVIGIILQALWSLRRKALKDGTAWVLGALGLAAYFLQVSPLGVLLGAGLVGVLVEAVRQRKLRIASLVLPLAGPLRDAAGAAGSAGTSTASLTGALAAQLPQVSSLPLPLALFLIFLKIGAVLYGSGYVLLAFLKADFVLRLGWLTDQQLLDAIAIGQVTPGPVFTTATFIGYVLAGIPGATLATLGIFLPSFAFVALSSRMIPRLRQSPWTAAALDAVNAASLGLMAAVTLDLGRDSLFDPLTVLLAGASLLILVRWQVNATWLILGGAILGLGKVWLF